MFRDAKILLSANPRRRISGVTALLLFCSVWSPAQSNPANPVQVPVYRVDTSWPQPLPNQWELGAICGIAVDQHGNVWIANRPYDSAPFDRAQIAGLPLPPIPLPSPHAAPTIIEFSPAGAVLASWGGPGPGYDWPKAVHGMYVDLHDNVWIAGALVVDNQILKFTNHGKFLLQIGHPGKNRGSNDTENLGGPANMVVDEAANELYVADGYVNHRIVVFDATTGAYKRHWGAYGKRPDDSYYTQSGIKPGLHTTNATPKPVTGLVPPQFDLVHGLRLSNDGLLYVCDRTHNRIQVFRKDGSFVQEAFLFNDILASGSVSDIDFSADPGQRFAFVADATSNVIHILDRKSLKVLASFGGTGKAPGQFLVAHNMAIDSRGNIFVADSEGHRLQKFVPAATQNSK